MIPVVMAPATREWCRTPWLGFDTMLAHPFETLPPRQWSVRLDGDRVNASDASCAQLARIPDEQTQKPRTGGAFL
jgi:hypothetical protein